eukprot:5054228-Pyramimonas_sp.AAC.1
MRFHSHLPQPVHLVQGSAGAGAPDCCCCPAAAFLPLPPMAGCDWCAPLLPTRAADRKLANSVSGQPRVPLKHRA